MSESKTEYIMIGEIVSAVGIKGEVKAKAYTDNPSRFADLDRVLLSDSDMADGDLRPIGIEKCRPQGSNMVVLKLEGVADRNAAEDLRGTLIYIAEEQLASLPEDTYYLRDLIGLMVYKPGETAGQCVGKIRDVLQTGPQDIYVIDVEGSDVLVPAVKEFIKDVCINREDPSNGYVVIDFIEGMLP